MDELTTTALTRQTVREKINSLQEKVCAMPEALIGGTPECIAVCPLKHTFVDGAYVREIFMPKETFIITKIHKKTHPFFIMKGDISILTDDGIVRVQGPYHGITKAGTRRVIYMHEDSVWITVHATKETDLAKIEDEVIAKTFDEVDFPIDIEGFIKEVKEIN